MQKACQGLGGATIFQIQTQITDPTIIDDIGISWQKIMKYSFYLIIQYIRHCLWHKDRIYHLPAYTVFWNRLSTKRDRLSSAKWEKNVPVICFGVQRTWRIDQYRHGQKGTHSHSGILLTFAHYCSLSLLFPLVHCILCILLIWERQAETEDKWCFKVDSLT